MTKYRINKTRFVDQTKTVSFTFDGKKFTTKLKTDKKKTSPSLPKMVTLRSGKKGTIAQRLKEIDREKAANKRLSLVRSSIRAKK